MNPIEQQFFNDLEKKLWTAADKLRSTTGVKLWVSWSWQLLDAGMTHMNPR